MLCTSASGKSACGQHSGSSRQNSELGKNGIEIMGQMQRQEKQNDEKENWEKIATGYGFFFELVDRIFEFSLLFFFFFLRRVRKSLEQMNGKYCVAFVGLYEKGRKIIEEKLRARGSIDLCWNARDPENKREREREGVICAISVRDPRGPQTKPHPL